MKKIIFSLIFTISLICLSIFYKTKTVEQECLESTCQVQGIQISLSNDIFNPSMKIGKVCGTGIVFYEDDEKYYILTAGHVTSSISGITVFVIFPDNTTPIRGKIEFSQFINDEDNHEDLGIISIQKEHCFKRQVIKLNKKMNEIGEKVFTIGCPGAEYQSQITTEIKDINPKEGTIIVGFNPIGGRSGSGVFNSSGTIVGIVTRTSGECVSSNKIIEIIEGCFSRLDISEPKPYNIEGGMWLVFLLGQCVSYPIFVGIKQGKIV